MKVHRYTSNGEGVWSAGKRLLPEALADKVNTNRMWLRKPNLPDGNYTFYLTKDGRDKYEHTLLKVHQKYLPSIELEIKELSNSDSVVFRDEHQVVILDN